MMNQNIALIKLNIVGGKLVSTPRNILVCLCPSCWNNATPPPSVFQRWHFLLGDCTSQKLKGWKSWKAKEFCLQRMSRQSQEKKGRIGLCLRNNKSIWGKEMIWWRIDIWCHVQQIFFDQGQLFRILLGWLLPLAGQSRLNILRLSNVSKAEMVTKRWRHNIWKFWIWHQSFIHNICWTKMKSKN